jgi:signal peptidase I
MKTKIITFLKEWVPTLLIIVILHFIISHYVFEVDKVPTASMYPTIKINDHLIAIKFENKDKLKYGDIVTFHPPLPTTDIYVKRLIGVSGDTIEVKEGSLYINGQKKEEISNIVKPNYNYGPITVPQGKYFFLGDNRNNSYDSHLWNTTPFVDKDAIIGKAVFRIFPFNTIGKM